MTNLVEQARALLVGQPKKTGPKHERTVHCNFRRCFEPHNLGGLNGGQFKDTDPLWGTTASGWLCGQWNIHRKKYEKLTGMFPGPDGVITEDLSEALA